MMLNVEGKRGILRKKKEGEVFIGERGSHCTLTAETLLMTGASDASSLIHKTSKRWERVSKRQGPNSIREATKLS